MLVVDEKYKIQILLLSREECVSVSAHLSELPVGERCMPIGEQSSRGVRLRMGTFPFVNGLVCEKNSFLFTLPLLNHEFHRDIQ